jgi:flagellar hook-length control protein FliK
MHMPGVTFENAVLTANQPVGEHLDSERQARHHASRGLDPYDRQDTFRTSLDRASRFQVENGPEGPQESSHRDRQEDVVREDAIRLRQEREAAESARETSKSASEAAQPGVTEQDGTGAQAPSGGSDALGPECEATQGHAGEGPGTHETPGASAASASVAGISVEAAAGTKMGSAAQQEQAGPAGPEGAAAGQTSTLQAPAAGKGASAAQAQAGTVAGGAPQQGRADGAEPRSAAAGSTGTGAEQTASGQGQVSPVHLYRQAGDGQATDRGAGDGAPSGTAMKATAGNDAPADGAATESSVAGASTRAVPDAETASRNTALRTSAGPSAGESAVKHAISQVSDGARTATAAAPAEPSSGQAGQATVGVRGGASAQYPGAAGRPLSDAGQQVAESIRATGGQSGRQVTVHLNPPELGRVRIVLESEGDAVRGTVRVDVPETLTKLQHEAGPLMQRLQADGIDLRRLDVTLNQEQAGGQTGRDAAFGEGQNDPDAWSPDASGRAFASADEEAAVSHGPETGGLDGAPAAAGRTDGSINVQV